jgi:hypothetical protein
MTDEQRAELRRGIEWLVRVVAASQTLSHADIRGSAVMSWRASYSWCDCHDYQVTARGVSNTATDPPPLTTAQQLALSVLIGDESVTADVLADYLLDQGHEYATACYERGREFGASAERERAKAEGEKSEAELTKQFRTRNNYIPCPVPGFD